MIDFISRVVSSSGFICLATKSTAHRGFDHACCDSPSKAQWLANKWVSEGRDVYFACGTLREKFIMVGDKKKRRVAENIHEMKSLFLDLDVGAEKPYKTQTEAVQHLVKFVKDVGLPTPLVVSSGYGVHVYWPFTVPVASDQWRKLSVKFKSLTEGYGLHADPARTSDVASILRLPGTKNFKAPESPRDVVVLSKKPVADTPPRALAQIIISACGNLNIVPKEPTALPTIKAADTGLGSFEVAQEPADFKEILRKCQVVRGAVKDQEHTAEPVWYATLQLVRHCDGFEKLAHAISFKHPTYDKSGTDQKLAQLIEKNVGPTLCATFDAKNPGGCTGCEHRGKINTPLVLGRSLKEATEKPSMVIDHGNGETTTVELPPPPYPYMRTTSGAIAMKQKDADGKELDPEVIYDFDIHPTKRMYDEVDQCEVFFFRSWLPQDGWREYPVPAYLIYDERKLLETIARKGVMPDMAQKSRLVGYMLGYIQSLQKSMPADQIYSQLGWRKNDTEILIGDRSYSQKGLRKVKIADQFSRILPKFEQRGTLDAWKKVADFYNKPGYEEYAFALMMGFGQMFFKFSGYSGALYNLYGDAGAGKSTVLRLIHSIYGVPAENALLHNDTTNAKIAMIGCYNNLPITYDEVTNIDPRELSDLCFAISNGRGKEALNQDRTLRENTATWQTTGYLSSNDPLMPKLVNLKGTTSGETYRMLERRITKMSNVDLVAAREVFEPLNSNYGVAGPVIAEWLVSHLDEAKAMMAEAYKEVAELAGAESQERFWVGMCAQAVVGARIGRLLGLHEYSVSQILAHAKRVIHETRGSLRSDVKTPTDTLVEYLNSHISQTLVTKINRAGFEEVIRHPIHKLSIRHEVDSSRAYITKSHFKAWCIENNYDTGAIETTLTSSGVIVATSANKALGAGTEFSTGRSPCYVIDMAHISLSGAATLTLAEKTTPTTLQSVA